MCNQKPPMLPIRHYFSVLASKHALDIFLYQKLNMKDSKQVYEKKAKLFSINRTNGYNTGFLGENTFYCPLILLASIRKHSFDRHWF